MKFQYVGAGNEDPNAIVFYGHEFKLNGEFVEVTDKEVVQKMRGIRTFKADGEPDGDLEALKEVAREKGITFHPAIGYAKLLAKVEAAN